MNVQQLKWKDEIVPDYYISDTGALFHDDRRLSTWIINGRNYSRILHKNALCTYRIDYMVAYTFIGMRDDAIRLIHIDDNMLNDNASNLLWYRKCDVKEKYKELMIIEDDGSIIEQWRPCNTEFNPNLHYEVSNLGMIRDSNGKFIPIYESHGYRVFYYLDSKYASQTRIKLVHRAVAEAFIPNPKGYTMVNHLDGDKSNDIVSNLEWSDNGMNAEHGYLQNLNNSNRYALQQIETVCKLLAGNDLSQIAISFMTGVDRKTVSDIYRGRRWREISSKYKMREKKWTPERKANIRAMIVEGYKGKEIATELKLDYDQPFISLYERTRRELKSQGKI